MSDLAERLIGHASNYVHAHATERLLHEAAAALTAQDAEIARLREALSLLVADVAQYEAWRRPCHALDVARAALGGKP